MFGKPVFYHNDCDTVAKAQAPVFDNSKLQNKATSAYNYEMPQSRFGLILLSFALAGVLTACGGGSSISVANNQNVPVRLPENSNAARTNVEELGLLVKVPYETEDIVWKEYTTKKRILAVLRFSPTNANKIVAEAGGMLEATGVAVESWFPDELIAQSEMSGDNALKGTAYPATAFYQQPYASGKIIRIEGTDYFILDLSAG
jgi:hypothetical protein